MTALNPKTTTALPIQRAFVIQIHADADVEQGYLSGKIEHIVSGQTQRFSNPEQLLAFIKRLLN